MAQSDDLYGGDEAPTSGGEVEGLKLRDLITAIEHLRNRVAAAEAKNTEAVTALSRNVGGFVERVQRLERVKPAEGSYDDLAGRVNKLEKSGGESQRISALKALEKAVSQVAVQFTNAQQTTLTRLDSAEQQLQDFAERIDQVGGDAEPANMTALKQAVEGLVERVARAEKAAEEATSLKDAAEGSTDPEFVEQTGARLRVLGDEIKRGGDQIRSLENTISKLSGQIEAAEKRSADGVQKVAETIADVRTQLLETDASEETAGSAVEAKLDATKKETEQRLDALQTSFDRINAKIEALSDAPAPETVKPVSEQTSDAASSTEIKAEADTLVAPEDNDLNQEIDEIEAAVEALEADAEKDPFSFADDLDAIDDENTSEAVEDFSFQLDDEADELESEPETTAEANDALADVPSEQDQDEGSAEAPTDAVDDARARLNKVRDALSADGLGATENPAEDGNTDDIDAILSELEGGLDDTDNGSITGLENESEPQSVTDSLKSDEPEDDDEQAPNTGSLVDHLVGPSEDPEPETDKVDYVEASSEATTTDEPKEDYLTNARRRAREAAALNNEAEDAKKSKRPSRRNLTAKQRAILAARARQKDRLTKDVEADTPLSADLPGTETNTPTPPEVTADIADSDDDETENTGGRFSKIKSALASARSKIARKKDDSVDAPTDDMGTDTAATTVAEPSVTEQAENSRNSDRAALDNIKSAPSARMVTLALGGAIIVAVLALLFLVKDFIFKPDGADAPSSITLTPSDTPATTENASDPSAQIPQSDLAVVPEAPAIDPQTLYAESIAALNAAEDDTAALAAIGQLQDAAALGYPPAQLQLGELFKTGQGVDQDLGQARVWFRRAANGGNVLAMHRIGVMTARGDGGPADSGEAINWFERAANFGLVDSQYNLGAIYHPSDTGGSSFQDASKAYYWYSLAARNGDTQAEPLAAGVAAGMTPDQRASVDEDVANWRASPSDPSANALAQSG